MLTNLKLCVQLCVLMLVTACQTITYTASCRVGDTVCQRNQDAQTLALIGHPKAATKLMCSDNTIGSLLPPSECTGAN